MKPLAISAAAREDLRAIAAYTRREWGAAQSERYLGRIRSRMSQLRTREDFGVMRPDLGRNLRSLSCEQHVIFYKLSSEAIEIVRILHQRMDVHRHLD